MIDLYTFAGLTFDLLVILMLGIADEASDLDSLCHVDKVIAIDFGNVIFRGQIIVSFLNTTNPRKFTVLGGDTPFIFKDGTIFQKYSGIKFHF